MFGLLPFPLDAALSHVSAGSIFSSNHTHLSVSVASFSELAGQDNTDPSSRRFPALFACLSVASPLRSPNLVPCCCSHFRAGCTRPRPQSQPAWGRTRPLRVEKVGRMTCLTAIYACCLVCLPLLSSFQLTRFPLHFVSFSCSLLSPSAF
jgi:hypothetical protein